MRSRIEFISRIVGAVVAAAALAILGVQLAAMLNLDPLRYGIALGVGGAVLGAVLGFLFTPYLTVRPISAGAMTRRVVSTSGSSGTVHSAQLGLATRRKPKRKTRRRRVLRASGGHGRRDYLIFVSL